MTLRPRTPLADKLFAALSDADDDAQPILEELGRRFFFDKVAYFVHDGAGRLHQLAQTVSPPEKLETLLQIVEEQREREMR